MRRIVALLLAIGCCASVAMAATSCTVEHEHTFNQYWNFDETYHWHDCTFARCEEISEKTEHRWNAGETISKPDEENAGIVRYTCLDCGALKNVSVAFDPSLGPTTTVSAEQCLRAFETDAFSNVSMIYRAYNGDEFSSEVYYRIGENGFYSYSLDEDGNKIDEAYELDRRDGTYVHYDRADDGTWYCKEIPQRSYTDYPKRLSQSYSLFAKYFDLFDYNENDRQYEYYRSSTMDEISVDYAVMKFEALKLSSLEFSMQNATSLDLSKKTTGYYQSFTFYDYGTTEVGQPEGNIVQISD